MNTNTRRGIPLLVLALGAALYFAYNGDANFNGFEVKRIALIAMIFGAVWLVIELALSFSGRKVSSRTVTDNGRGRPVETYHEEDVR